MNEAQAEFFNFFADSSLEAFGFRAAMIGVAIVVWRAYGSVLSAQGESRRFLARVSLNLIAFHVRVYNFLCGSHPARRPWHCQWLSVKDLYRDLRRVLPAFRGQMLDVGCLGKPYAGWIPHIDKHVGIDVTPGVTVDHVIREGERWPLESETFQSVLCTQVLQVAKDPTHLIAELHRVLEPGGIAIIATPFCFRDMSSPVESGGTYKDYWRHSVHGVEELVTNRFEIVELKRQGGVGSTAGSLILNWILFSVARRVSTQLVFAAMLPVWLPFCLFVNTTAVIFDKLDVTGAYYHNVFVVLRKPAPAHYRGPQTPGQSL